MFQFGQYTAIQEERAVKFHERNMLLRILREWADYAAEEKMATWNKERQAKQHNIRPVVGNTVHLKRGYIQFKYYADAIHSGLTPPG